MGSTVDCRNAAGRTGERDADNLLGIDYAANVGFAAIIGGLPATAITLRVDYRLDIAELGAAFGLLGLGVLLSEIPWHMLTHRWGKRGVLTTGLAGTAAALAAMMLLLVPTPTRVPGVALLAGSLLVVGLLSGCIVRTSGRAVMTWFSDSKRGYAMSLRQTAMLIGAGLGASVLPILAMQFGFAAVYGALALTCTGLAVLAWRSPHERAPTAAHAGGAAAGVSGMSPRLGHGVWRLASAIGLLCVPQVAVLSFAAIFLHDVSRLDPVTIGLSLAAMQTGAAVARVASGYWTDRHSNRRDYLIGCALTSAGLFALLALMVWTAMDSTAAVPTTSLGIVLVLLAAGICVSAWHGVAYAELATLAGPARIATAFALANTSVFLAFFFVPLGVPALLAWESWPSVWMAACLCAVIALLLFDKEMHFDQDVWG
jgi:MFS family permease